MRTLRAALLWTGIGLATLLFGLPAVVAAFVPPRGDWFLRFARGWARTILFMSGVPLRVSGRERLASLASGSAVIVANHESLADILVLLASLPIQVRFLAKRRIFSVPVLGWSIRAAGFIPVDRGDHRRGAATFEAAMARLQGGRSVIVFPEETRTRTGELLPFKKGAALLALRSGLPILPVGIAGTRRVLPRDTLLPTAGPAAVVIGEPIPVEGRPVTERAKLTEEAKRAVALLRDEAARALGR
ncbi:MAG TPA: lysophospholipid acyltransferase family protein [Thermoanaerobaculia bacterium]|nr:lysophospholipid acyltransferase family protein [Thermoanaerobaculia bacterium]